jgi:hypothetical protein
MAPQVGTVTTNDGFFLFLSSLLHLKNLQQQDSTGTISSWFIASTSMMPRPLWVLMPVCLYLTDWADAALYAASA